MLAFETTYQTYGLLPLLAGCAASYLVATLAAKNSIMTEKIARMGIRALAEYLADPLEQVVVGDIASKPVVTLRTTQTVDSARRWLAVGSEKNKHQGFPIVDPNGHLVGVLTRRDLLDPRIGGGRELREILFRPPKFVYDDCTARQAANHMVNHNIGRLPVVMRSEPTRLIGIVTRSDILCGLPAGDRRERGPTPRHPYSASFQTGPLVPCAPVPLVPFDEVRPVSDFSAHAVEEYPTENGPADYALVVKGQLLGVVEAKKGNARSCWCAHANRALRSRSVRRSFRLRRSPRAVSVLDQR